MMSFWDWSFFNNSVPDLNEEPPVEYSYGTIDLNAEPNADVGFDSQALYGFVYDDSKQSYTEEGYEEKPGASNVNWETKEVITASESSSIRSYSSESFVLPSNLPRLSAFLSLFIAQFLKVFTHCMISRYTSEITRLRIEPFSSPTWMAMVADYTVVVADGE
ncbi:hypothetical protein E3N88_06199 [Mikania micrantha]|uniref:Uncharacterized protein n=1 Tax=Mikania micrantha TaxID=192012 RepID=A0A5N6PN45_9ASTR|nr:hypothetical protein E3N88_06199 [Mikania micrantha]